MLAHPRTRGQAEKHRYNVWGGNPKGNQYYPERCAEEITEINGWLSYQCTRKPGHGPAKLYCKQHAKKL
jgi:hypothetical protein